MLDEIALIESNVFSDAWDLSIFSEMSRSNTQKIFAAVEDESVIGYCCFQVVLDEAELLRIAVVPEKRQKGIGKALLDFSFKVLEDIGANTFFLEVREENLPARNLYKLMNFVEIARRCDYYAKGEHAVIMKKAAESD